MPRRLPVRPVKIIGNLFVLFVLIVISTIYYTYVGVVFGPKLIDATKQTSLDGYLIMGMLVIFHILFVMLVWSFFQSMITDPGQVPVFWGFHLGDAENKRRRYCLMCNVFKPERCHHCSACNRCVLNMDHHCPWINNCIGFWNRKYFMLLLVYVLLCTYFVATTMFYEFMMTIKWEVDAFYFQNTERDRQLLFRACLIQISYILTCIVAVLLTMFLKFHIYLASSNKTTIENLDKKGKPYRSPYDIGSVNNIYQIFGTNKWLWPFPVFCGSGKPLGDGIYWPTNVQGGSGGNDVQSHYSSNGAGRLQAAPANNNVQSPPSQLQAQRSYEQSLNGQKAQGSLQSKVMFYNNIAQIYPDRLQELMIITTFQVSISSSQLPLDLTAPQGSQWQHANAHNMINPAAAAQHHNFSHMNYVQQTSQEIGQPQNKIIMHGQDKDQLKKNLNAAIFLQNNQRAMQLAQAQQQQQQIFQSHQQIYGAPNQQRMNNSKEEQYRGVSSAVAGNQSQQPTSGKMLPKNRRDGNMGTGTNVNQNAQRTAVSTGAPPQKRAVAGKK